MLKELGTALRAFVLLTLITGILYPLAVTAIGRAVFPSKAAGSILSRNGVPIGSRLIAQKFVSAKYFHPRPSAIDWNPLPSGGSNLGMTSVGLRDAIALQEKDGAIGDLRFASASGLDPEISPESARVQIDRVATARGLDAIARENLGRLVAQHETGRTFGVLGEERVNVLELNLAIDEAFRK